MAETVVTSSCYFPPIVFFNEFAAAKNILVDAHEYFVKQTLRNRTYICSANGKAPLIVPVKHTGGKLTAVKDIEISYGTDWQKNHWRSITSAYRNSAWFEFMEDDIAPFFFTEEKYLCDLNEKILYTLLRLCNLNAVIARTQNYMETYAEPTGDIRQLSDVKCFNEYHTIKKSPVYQQVFSQKLGFTGGLSILDLLFNEGKHASEYLSASQIPK
jgi:hypothetical protein